MAQLSLGALAPRSRLSPREDLAQMLMLQNMRPVNTIGGGVSSLANIVAGGLIGGRAKERRIADTKSSLAAMVGQNFLSPKARAFVEAAVKSGSEEALADARAVALSDMTKTPARPLRVGGKLVDPTSLEVLKDFGTDEKGPTYAQQTAADEIKNARKYVDDWLDAQQTAGRIPQGVSRQQYLETQVVPGITSINPANKLLEENYRRARESTGPNDASQPYFMGQLGDRPGPRAPWAASAIGQDVVPPPEPAIGAPANVPPSPGVVDQIRGFFGGGGETTVPVPVTAPEAAIEPARAVNPMAAADEALQTDPGARGPSAGERFMAALHPESRRFIDETSRVQTPEDVRTAIDQIGSYAATGARQIGSNVATGARQIGSNLSSAAHEIAKMMGLGGRGASRAEDEPTTPESAPVDWIVPSVAAGRASEAAIERRPTRQDEDVLDFAPGMKPSDLIPGKTYRSPAGVKGRWNGRAFEVVG